MSNLTVLHTRQLADLSLIQADVLSADGRSADLFLRFAQATSAAAGDEPLLMQLISEYTFRAFPQATHQILAVIRGTGIDGLTPLLARSRDGSTQAVALSRTLAARVIQEGVAILFAPDGQRDERSDSMVLSGMQTAVCAPLLGQDGTFGVMQLDIRDRAKAIFNRKDLDRAVVFARQVALVLDNLRLHQEHRQAFESTINALVHSLSLKDPSTAQHSERVQRTCLIVGESLGLSKADLEALGVAAILHDMGKQGIRDEVLFKPAVLTPEERAEMSMHSGFTQDILDKIHYPPHLRQVPLVASYHHEKMNGSGPYGIAGEQIPIASRVISVADVFDALVSARVYKEPRTPEEVLAILEKGRGQEWDGAVLDAFRACLPQILHEVYGEEEERAAA